MNWYQQAGEELRRLFGTEEGNRLAIVIFPGILADFRKMLARSLPGKPVAEEYGIEGKTMVIRLRGEKRAGGGRSECLLTAVEIGSRVIIPDKGGVVL